MANTEIGQGARTTLAQIAADALGWPLEAIEVATPDTGLVPDSGPTVASRTCMVVGGLLERCGAAMKEKLGGLAPRDYLAAHGPLVVTEQYRRPAGTSWSDETYRGDAYGTFGWGCNVVELELDPDTCEVRPTRVTAAIDVGRAIHPQVVAGQIEGATAQGLGWALLEEVVMRDGSMANASLTDYIIPTAIDTPPIEAVIVERPYAHGPFGASDVADRFGLGVAVVRDALRRLVAAGRVVEGELRPLTPDAPGTSVDYCDAKVLRLLRRRSLAALRAEVEPVAPRDLVRFLPPWQGVGTGLRGADALMRAIEQLAGVPLPASALETLILPARVADYHPALLDELTASGDVLWQGHGSLAGDDGWISLHPSEIAHLTLRTPTPDEFNGLSDDAHRVLDVLSGGGAYFFRGLAVRLTPLGDEALADVLWDLVWSGHVTGDTFAPLRAYLSGGRTAHKQRATAPRRSSYAGRGSALRGVGRLGASSAAATVRSGPPRTAGRWSVLPQGERDATITAYARAEILLDRYGVVTRGAVVAEDLPGGFAGVYRLLAAAEEAGRVRRGYFVEGLGASQFGTTGAVDRLRAGARPLEDSPAPAGSAPALVLAACDPANPFGAALPWPARPSADDDSSPTTKGHQPARKAGALVVVVDGDLVLYVERGGKTLLTWTDDPTLLQAGAHALARAVRDGALGKLTVEKTDGASVLRSDHPLTHALAEAGFHATPRGLRLRR